jgi:hypothetical protein
MIIELIPTFLFFECRINGVTLPFVRSGSTFFLQFKNQVFAMTQNKYVFGSSVRRRSIDIEWLKGLTIDNTFFGEQKLIASKLRYSCMEYRWVLQQEQIIFENSYRRYWRDEKNIIIMLESRTSRFARVLSFINRGKIIGRAKDSFVDKFPALIPIFLMSIIEI